MTRSGHVCGRVLVGSYVVGAYLAGIRPRVLSEGLGNSPCISHRCASLIYVPLVGVCLSQAYISCKHAPLTSIYLLLARKWDEDVGSGGGQ
jgi:hypothetical protein